MKIDLNLPGQWVATLYRLLVGGAAAGGAILAINVSPAYALAGVVGAGAISSILQALLSSQAQRFFLARFRSHGKGVDVRVRRIFVVYALKSILFSLIGLIAFLGAVGFNRFGLTWSDYLVAAAVYVFAAPALVSQKYILARIGLHGLIVNIALISMLLFSAYVVGGVKGAFLYQYSSQIACSMFAIGSAFLGAVGGVRVGIQSIFRNVLPSKVAARYLLMEFVVVLFGVGEQLLLNFMDPSSVDKHYLIALRVSSYLSALVGLHSVSYQARLISAPVAIRDRLIVEFIYRAVVLSLSAILFSAAVFLLIEARDFLGAFSLLFDTLPAHLLCGGFVFTAYTSAILNSRVLPLWVVVLQSLVLAVGFLGGAVACLTFGSLVVFTAVKALFLVLLGILHCRVSRQ